MVREDHGFGDAIVTIRTPDDQVEERIKAGDIVDRRDLPEIDDIAVSVPDGGLVFLAPRVAERMGLV